MKIYLLLYLFSDIHNIVTVTFTATTNIHEPNHNDTAKLNKWKNDKEKDFIDNLNQDVLQDIISLLEHTNSSINDINNKISQVLLESAEKTLGKQQTKLPTMTNYSHNYECRMKKREYNRAKTKLKYSKTPLNILNKRKACREYKIAVRKAEKMKTQRLLSKLKNLKNTDARTYWKIISNKSIDKAQQPSIPQLEHHFKGLNIMISENTIDESNVNCISADESNYDDSLLNEPITEEEIISASKKLKNNKSPGVDNIVNEYIKASIMPMMKCYVGLFNKILDSGVFPEAWSIGLIIPLYKKKGDRKDSNNYRGITLLSCVGKLFTTVLNERLKAYCESNNIISENQAGFRTKHSTTDHIFSLKMLLDLMFNSKQKLFCAFVDYEKAFDTVWRDGLWRKLDMCGVYKTSKVYNIIVNMYKSVKSCVFSRGMKSNYFASNAGVRQGENLSPLLFALFINDLESYLLAKGNNYIDFNDNVINNFVKLLVLLYADDTIILSNTAAGLQKLLNDLESYCTMWKLRVNGSKTKVVIFGKRKPKIKPKFMYKTEELELVEEFKYLGVVFSCNATFKKHKMYLKDQATKAMFALLSKGRRLKLPVDIMLDLFDKTVLPVLLYGCEVWGYEKNIVLDTVYLKFCKYLLSLKTSTPNCMVYGELGTYPVSITIKVRLVSYWLNIISADENKISKQMYNLMYNLHQNDTYQSDWLNCVRNILEVNGFGYIWVGQGINSNAIYIKELLKHTLQAQFAQEWHSEMDLSRKCTLYRHVKTEFKLEPYLLKLSRDVFRYIVKLRCSNHKLAIETGRYYGIDRNLRYCDMCNLDVLGDEYHVFFECANPDIVTLRQQCIPRYYLQNPSMFKLIQLLKSSDDVKIGKRISMFIKKCKIA